MIWQPLLTGHCGWLWSLSAWFSHSYNSCTSLFNIWHCFVCAFPCLWSSGLVCYDLFMCSVIVDELGCSSFLLWTISKWLWELLQVLLIWLSHSLWVRYYFFQFVREKTGKQHIQGHTVVVSGEVRVWPTLQPRPHRLHRTLPAPISIRNWRTCRQSWVNHTPAPLRERIKSWNKIQFLNHLFKAHCHVISQSEVVVRNLLVVIKPTSINTHLLNLNFIIFVIL